MSKRVVLPVGLTAAVLALVSGCAREQEALVVARVPAFTDGSCSADSNSDATMPEGNLDVAFGTPYTLPVILRNNLLSRPGNTSNTGVDNGELQLRDVDITLSMPQAPEVLSEVAARNGAYVEFNAPLAANALDPGVEAGILVDVISDGASLALSEAIAAQLDPDARPLVLVELVFHATRTGNSRGRVGIIDSRAYSFPIKVCNRCLLDCTTCGAGTCAEDTDFVGGFCNNAQDALLNPTACAAG